MSLHQLTIPLSTKQYSRFMRTTWMLTARQTLDFGDFEARVRFIGKKEADSLVDLAQRRNAFARHSWENSFYVDRLRQFSETTVIEIDRPGDPDKILAEARLAADCVEWLCALSTTFAFSRTASQRKLGITEHKADIIDFVIGPSFKYLRSSRVAQASRTGIPVDDRFIRRFRRLGFPGLARVFVSSHPLSGRLRAATKWLLASRLDPTLEAAIVKTSIALESLLGASSSEPLSRSLSERTAFILGKDFRERRDLALAIRRFYDMRSGVVHGNRQRKNVHDGEILEGADRIVLLLCLAMSANGKTMSTMDNLVAWCEDCRWGSSPQRLQLPYKPSSVRNALQCFQGIL